MSTQPVMRACADDAHLALDLEPIANHRREVVEHLRQIAARLALGQHRGDEEPRVEQQHAAANAFNASGSGMPKFCWS